jgi:hypothetical protein
VTLPDALIVNEPLCRLDRPEVELQTYCLLAFTVKGDAKAKL